MAIEITNDNFKKEVEESSLPVVLDIYASWCGPCKQMEPIINELEKELGAKYKFTKLNVDQSRELAIKFGVTSIPTFLFIINGKVVGKETGYMSKDDFITKLNTNFKW